MLSTLRSARARSRVATLGGGSRPYASDVMDEAKNAAMRAAEKVKGTASQVVDKAKGAMESAKEFVSEAKDRIKADQESYSDAIKNQANRAAQAAQGMGDRLADTADKAAAAAAAGNAAAVQGATGKLNEMYNPSTGMHGPAAGVGTGGEEARTRAARQDDPSSVHPATGVPKHTEVGPEGAKGPHIITNADGQQASST